MLVWREPGSSAKEAVKAAACNMDCSPRDRIISVEWLGSDPMPIPRWYRELLMSALPPEQRGYITDALRRLGGQSGVSDAEIMKAPPMPEWSDNDLLHAVFGVTP